MFEPRSVREVLPDADLSTIRGGRRRAASASVIAVGLLFVAVVAAVAFGSVNLALGDVFEVFVDRSSGNEASSTADQIIWNLRLPRVVLAAVVGAALTTSGAVMQVLVRNALADPFLLGVSAGASVGATAVLLFGVFSGLGLWAVSAGSALGSLVAIVSVLLLAGSGTSSPTQLILIGVVMSALFQSITSFLIFRGDPNATQGVLFWLLGSFGRATWDQIPIPLGVLVISLAYLLAHRRSLNALAMGDEAASGLGIEVVRLRRKLFVVASICAASTVAVAGVIGFIGLVVPHLVRIFVGVDHRRVLPLGLVVGATFTVLADLAARTVVSPQEMPLGVVSAVIGAPMLLLLVRRRSASAGVT